MGPTAPQDDTSSFRRFRVESISEDRSPEIDRTYGIVDGVGATLEAYRYVGAGDADVSMRGAEVEGTRSGRLDPRPDHIVFWIADGTATIEDATDGSVLTAVPGHPVLLSASVPYRFAADTRKITMLHLSDRILRQALARRGRTVAGALVFGQQADIASALGPLRAILRNRAAALSDEQVDGAGRAALNAEIAASVVEAFPLVAPDADEPRSAAVLAAQWMHEHAAERIALRDVAAAVGLSERGLQSSFRRRFDETPMERLRAERLDGARTDLRFATPGTHVRDIARRWQFGHFGRFAANYAERFGESPSETLRRAREAAERGTPPRTSP
ncbi:helix-turn-helix transcriptional regulator [Curtobacterium luteum]|uniref:helix-turn-helix transcriptional regulator n=1 Tax=Curtobacterium luteum TaxID=33881 RepID=UPI003824B836